MAGSATRQPLMSPPTDRVVAVLDLLAAAREPLGAAEIARRLGISGSTCATVLSALAGAEYVQRGPHKRYELGPGLLPVADALRTRFPLLGAADDELHRLNEDLDCGITLTRIGTDQLQVVAACGSPSQLPEGVAPGHRLPLTPPFGVVARAWAPRADVDRWLKLAPVRLDRAQVAQYRRVMREIRERGYVVWSLEPATSATIDAVRALLTELASAPPSAARRDQLAHFGALLAHHALTPAELRGPRRLSVSYLLAPVGPGPAPHYQAELHLLAESISPSALQRVITRFRTFLERVGALTADAA
jgi:DNA-binding IclR family transcriptional regulator